MIAQIEAFSRNRLDQSSAQAEFCTDNTKYALNVRHKYVLKIWSSSSYILLCIMYLDTHIRRCQCFLLFVSDQGAISTTVLSAFNLATI